MRVSLWSTKEGWFRRVALCASVMTGAGMELDVYAYFRNTIQRKLYRIPISQISRTSVCKGKIFLL
jgi:hypothetical protein